jgi:hypothetical protein
LETFTSADVCSREHGLRGRGATFEGPLGTQGTAEPLSCLPGARDANTGEWHFRSADDGNQKQPMCLKSRSMYILFLHQIHSSFAARCVAPCLLVISRFRYMQTSIQSNAYSGGTTPLRSNCPEIAPTHMFSIARLDFGTCSTLPLNSLSWMRF